MSKKIEKKENVTLTYKNDKITVKGDTIWAEVSLSSDQLTKMYYGSQGKGTVKIAVDVPEEQPQTPIPVIEDVNKKTITLQTFIEDLAAKGLTEEEIMKTTITV